MIEQILAYLMALIQRVHGTSAKLQGSFTKKDLALVLEAGGHDLEEIIKDARARGKDLVNGANEAMRRADQSVEDEREALRRALASATASKKRASRNRVQGESYLQAVRNLGAK